ncbi:hypothetical protein Lalb_Chr01g0003991 [Lupinus albus]|uniref:Uncharacterized protein n=1 Tax=Lupinus albus TaxID=3870 RepID=A0A6A4R5C1_LUPAL|nr:hypothetical protein Lalb_Chr01g0003991 [Lupinus albus]
MFLVPALVRTRLCVAYIPCLPLPALQSPQVDPHTPLPSVLHIRRHFSHQAGIHSIPFVLPQPTRSELCPIELLEHILHYSLPLLFVYTLLQLVGPCICQPCLLHSVWFCKSISLQFSWLELAKSLTPMSCFSQWHLSQVSLLSSIFHHLQLHYNLWDHHLT